jgi:hypothetical protein
VTRHAITLCVPDMLTTTCAATSPPPRQAAPAGSSSAHSSWNLGEVALLDKQSGLKTAASYYNWVTPGVPAVVYESSSYQVGRQLVDCCWQGLCCIKGRTGVWNMM